MSLSYLTREERTIVPGAIAPDLIIKLRAISDGVAKLWVERGNMFVSCDDMPDLYVNAPAVGGFYIIEWVKGYDVYVCGQRVATITCQREQSLLATSAGASIV
jgi:hypothetical protein